jgi:hypothetical protein
VGLHAPQAGQEVGLNAASSGRASAARPNLVEETMPASEGMAGSAPRGCSPSPSRVAAAGVRSGAWSCPNTSCWCFASSTRSR